MKQKKLDDFLKRIEDHHDILLKSGEKFPIVSLTRFTNAQISAIIDGGGIKTLDCIKAIQSSKLISDKTKKDLISNLA